MADIFISYARADRDYARRLAAYLEDSGLSVWWDMSLKPGEVFRDEIERRIGEAHHVIVLWSETSVKSHFVLDEAGEAARQNKLVPLRIDGCTLPLGFGQHHTHTVSNWPGDLAAVLAAVGGAKSPPKPDSTASRTAQDFFNSGEICLSRQELDRAIFLYSEAIRFSPDYAAAYYKRAVVYHQQGENSLYRLGWHPQQQQIGFGQQLRQRQQELVTVTDCFARAIDDYNQALRIDPTYNDAWTGKVRAQSIKTHADSIKTEVEKRLAPSTKKGWF
jgi:tetratricopeptide (TPR) repeat protein